MYKSVHDEVWSEFQMLGCLVVCAILYNLPLVYAVVTPFLLLYVWHPEQEHGWMRVLMSITWRRNFATPILYRKYSHVVLLYICIDVILIGYVAI